jgi:hypothetical protein
MISIILSSYQLKYFDQFQKNIANTIGVEYEVIKVDNPGLMSITEAYNIGVEKAKYQILCFAHEDIVIKTMDWGKKVIEIFEKNANLGLLGIAGNLYKSITPSHWSFPTAHSNSFYVNVLHNSVKGNKMSAYFSNPKKCNFQEVATIDGVWFCVPKSVAEEFPFDNQTCTGFHAYDVDYSLTIQQKYTVAVTFDILIHHFSTGTFKRDWIEDTLKVHKKWKADLPILVEAFDGFDQQEEEKKAAISFMKKMVDNGYPFKEVLKIYRFQNQKFRYSLNMIVSILYQLIRYKYFLKSPEKKLYK